MSIWLVAALVLLGTLLPLGIVAVRAAPLEALVAVELAGVIAALALLLLSQAFDRQAFGDLALALAVMAFAGSLVLVRFLQERG